MKLAFPLVVCLAASGCSALPGEGPSAGSILSDAGRSSPELNRSSTAVYDVVDLDVRTASTLDTKKSSLFQSRLGNSSRSARPVIGIGDTLKVSIFEAGANGLFSTGDRKQTNLDVVIQPDGKAAVPYVGSVRFAGLTLEQVRQSLLTALSGRAVEPDVLVSSVSAPSRQAVISGAVNDSKAVSLSLGSETVTGVIAKAGGPSRQPYETYVTLVRNGSATTTLLQNIIDNPTENVQIQPKDRIFLTATPRTFVFIGAAKTPGRKSFGARDINLAEAVALGGGVLDESANAKGFFVFRYEDEEIVRSLLGPDKFASLLSKGYKSDAKGRLPIVYRFDMSAPDSLLIGQRFSMESGDVLYVARHISNDLMKFFGVVESPLSLSSQGARLSNQVKAMSE